MVDQINDNNLELIDLLAASPAEIIIMGDNFSSDVQPPRFFAKWSRPYYAEAIRRLHAAGKYVAVHIDGRLRGAIGMIRDAGADCGDAVTPAPMGDLTPRACRDEAGPDFILSGGVPPNLWLPDVPVEVFKRSVLGLARTETLRPAPDRQRRRPGSAARRRRPHRDHARPGGEARQVLESMRWRHRHETP